MKQSIVSFLAASIIAVGKGQLVFVFTLTDFDTIYLRLHHPADGVCCIASGFGDSRPQIS